MHRTVHKYKKLVTNSDLDRFCQMIRGNFWFSKFHQQNDPMEGVYWHLLRDEQTRQLRDGKNGYIICSFGLSNNNPTLWAYYPEGFRGVCIEARLDDKWNENSEQNIFRKIVYIHRNEFQSSIDSETSPLDLIIRKLNFWEPESEARLILKTNTPGNVNIGTVKSVTVGCKVDPCLAKLLLCRAEEYLENVNLKISYPNDTEDGQGHISLENFSNPVNLLQKLEDYREWRNFFEI